MSILYAFRGFFMQVPHAQDCISLECRRNLTFLTNGNIVCILLTSLGVAPVVRAELPPSPTTRFDAAIRHGPLFPVLITNMLL